jgi:hypothetical protein
LVNERRTVDVRTARGPFKVTYRPHELTPAREELLADEINSDGTSSDPMLELFEDLIVEMELEGPLYTKDHFVTRYDEQSGEERREFVKGGVLLVDDGEPIPPKPEYTRHLSSQLFTKIMTTVREDMNDDPKPPSGRSGGGSFGRTSRTRTPQNGTT